MEQENWGKYRQNVVGLLLSHFHAGMWGDAGSFWWGRMLVTSYEQMSGRLYLGQKNFPEFCKACAG